MIEAMIQEARAREAQRALEAAEAERQRKEENECHAKYELLGRIAYWFGEEVCSSAFVEVDPPSLLATARLPHINRVPIALRYTQDRDGSMWELRSPEAQIFVRLSAVKPKVETLDQLLVAIGKLTGL